MKLVFDLPDGIDMAFTEHDLTLAACYGWYKMGIMSSGILSEIAGISRTKFIEEMGKYGKTIFDYSDEEYQRDEINAGKFVR